MNTSILKVLVIALAAATIVGCKTKKQEVTPPGGGGDDTNVPITDTGMDKDWSKVFIGKEALENNPCLKPRVIKFDLDRTEIASEFDGMLTCHATFIKMNPTFMATLEGHADERGTREYNLGLGERRGNAVGDMLKAKDAPSGQMSNVSFGEERPTCSDSMDSCWADNRRVEIVYSEK
jgi:peptidoglycan-associated lipoprotein